VALAPLSIGVVPTPAAVFGLEDVLSRRNAIHSMLGKNLMDSDGDLILGVTILILQCKITTSLSGLMSPLRATWLIDIWRDV
jgi:hypothetical protein